MHDQPFCGYLDTRTDPVRDRLPLQAGHRRCTVTDDYGEGDRHVFNLGYGIHPGVEPDRVGLLVDTVHQKSAR